MARFKKCPAKLFPWRWSVIGPRQIISEDPPLQSDMGMRGSTGQLPDFAVAFFLLEQMGGVSIRRDRWGE